MIKQTVAYTNLDGQPATEDLYFNLNKAELIDLELEQERSMSDMLKEVGEDPTAKDVLWMLKTFVHRSYGKRSEDGRKFVKNETVLEDFIDSEPYSEFLWGLINDPKKAMEFIHITSSEKIQTVRLGMLRPKRRTFRKSSHLLGNLARILSRRIANRRGAS